MTQARLTKIELFRLRLPLTTPYRLSYRTFDEFEPIIVVIRDELDRFGFGEAHISPGSSKETRANGWAFCSRHGENLLGLDPTTALAQIAEHSSESPVAATAMHSAIEMLQGHPLLAVEQEARLPLLTPFNALTADAIGEEVEHRLAQGFRTIKIKVGNDADADLARVGAIQRASTGRATLRIDANRGYGREDGCRFASALNPDGIELFEQPCAAEDWDANAAVAAVSTVPLMLDEPICAVTDIERAADIPGVGFCKLKLKRFGGLQRLNDALLRVRELGMEPVLGDGLASEFGCWMEACIARTTIRNAGEFNGFLKPSLRLLQQPLIFAAGELVLQPGLPRLDRNRLEPTIIEETNFTA